MSAVNEPKPGWPLDRLVYLPMLASLAIIWIIFIRITLIERNVILAQATQQLEVIIATLANFNELTQDIKVVSQQEKDQQSAVVWNALLNYPTASIWVESNGMLISGQPSKTDPKELIVAETIREHFSVHATIPKADVLTDWHRQLWQRCVVLILISLVFVVLTRFLARALKQRAIAEYKMRKAHSLLQNELASRKVIEKELREHDMLLNAITQAASRLLGTQSHEEAIGTVLALIGDTISVDWIHLYLTTPESADNSSDSVRFEWFSPNVEPAINDPAFRNLNITSQFHKLHSTDSSSEAASLYTDELPSAIIKPLQEFHMQSFLYVPLLADLTPAGCLLFIDSSNEKRQWSWAETDALKILAGLIGTTITRMRYIKELAEANRRAGMAEIANNVLHNVGNVLNSVKISANLVAHNLQNSKVSSLGKATDLINQHISELGTYLTTDPKGKILPEFLTELYENFLFIQNKNIGELESLLKSIEHINNIVTKQQEYTGITIVLERVDIRNLIEDSLRMSVVSSADDDIEVIQEYEIIPLVNLDKHKVLQILINLINNAKHACNDSDNPTKRITMRVCRTDDWVKIAVIDNGIGISPENINRIFNLGFTTRQKGHGFGLHNSVLAAREMSGSLHVQSDGLGKGATFILELPLQ
jgi:signal transduction histidine kinase